MYWIYVKMIGMKWNWRKLKFITLQISYVSNYSYVKETIKQATKFCWKNTKFCNSSQINLFVITFIMKWRSQMIHELLL